MALVQRISGDMVMHMRGSVLVLAILVATTGAGLLAAPAAAQAGGCAAASASCQTNLQLAITPPSACITPLQEVASVPIDVRYTYTDAGVSLITTPVTLEVIDAPAWVVISFTPQVLPLAVVQPSGATTVGNTRESTGTVIMQVAATINSPAFQPTSVKIQGTAAANGGNAQSTAQQTFTMCAGYFGIIDAVADTTIQKGGPQKQISFPITVTNFGNGQTKVFFDISAKPEGDERGYQVIAPQPIILESRQEGGRNIQKQANLQIQLPFKNGYVNNVGAVTVDITSNYALNQQFRGDR
ncbi:MAG: hypothetical protein ACT4PT_05305, partial [Methanobacteriota archaeon]